ncbi:MAG: hypothetical protein WC761_06880 [Candidatus Paceibacterota bacterium]|jgi:hypothetical protein
MREIFQKLKLPLIIIAVLIAGYVLYNSFIKAPKQTSILQQTSRAAATSTPDRDFLPLLLSIQSVSLDQKIFIDPVFRALVDWSQQIVPENIGKQNPFSGQLVGSVNSSVESLGFTDSIGTAPVTAPRTTTR